MALLMTAVISGGVYASSGTEGAAFLDIPVGGGPAAMGAAYTALANDAYAPTYNPGGLGFVDSTQFSGQHLSYLDSIHYEYLSFVMPLPRSNSCESTNDCSGSAIGGSMQYLGSGDIDATEVGGTSLGTFSSYYSAYNLAYGHAFNSRFSLGATGKLIHAKIDDVAASAYAADLGGMYRVDPKITLAATVTNLGSKLTFLSDGDPLPLAVHVGAAYKPTSQVLISLEGVYPKTGLASFHVGGQWRPLEMLSLRAGYRTDTVKQLSALSGLSAGVGVHLWGQELAYAWLPYGDLGDTHYISLLMKFGEAEKAKRNLIQYQRIKTHRTVKNSGPEEIAPDYQQLMELLNDTEQHLARNGTSLRGNE